MTSVFVSRPTWTGAEFAPGLSNFLELLKTLELEPKTLGATDYPSETPLDEVIDLMAGCTGAIILGYPQVECKRAVVKGKPKKDLLLATEWNHIEASLAYASGLPLLLIHHVGVCRGVFDRGTMSNFLYERDLTKADWFSSVEIQGALRQWKRRLGPSLK
jgi:hypothetical protein